MKALILALCVVHCSTQRQREVSELDSIMSKYEEQESSLIQQDEDQPETSRHALFQDLSTEEIGDDALPTGRRLIGKDNVRQLA